MNWGAKEEDSRDLGGFVRSDLFVLNTGSIPSSFFISSPCAHSSRTTSECIFYQVFCLSARLCAISMTVFSVEMGVQLNVVLALVVSMTFCLGSGEPGTPRTALGNWARRALCSGAWRMSRKGWYEKAAGRGYVRQEAIMERNGEGTYRWRRRTSCCPRQE